MWGGFFYAQGYSSGFVHVTLFFSLLFVCTVFLCVCICMFVCIYVCVCIHWKHLCFFLIIFCTTTMMEKKKNNPHPPIHLIGWLIPLFVDPAFSWLVVDLVVLCRPPTTWWRNLLFCYDGCDTDKVYKNPCENLTQVFFISFLFLVFHFTSTHYIPLFVVIVIVTMIIIIFYLFFCYCAAISCIIMMMMMLPSTPLQPQIDLRLTISYHITYLKSTTKYPILTW